MTMPDERTRAVILTGQFLDRLSTPYGNGIKGVPKDVREMARRLRRHYPHWFDLGRTDAFDEQTAKRLAEEEDDE